jgi:hypothetical protein
MTPAHAPVAARERWSFPPPADLQRLQARLFGLGGGLLVLVGAGALLNPDQFFRSWLIGWMLWAGAALGCLGVLMLQHLTGGAWGIVIRRPLEAGTRTLPLLALLFVPILAGLKSLYPWARPEVVAADELLQHKAAYLNGGFFTLRAALIFAVWIGLAAAFNRWSLQQDTAPAQGPVREGLEQKLGRFAGPGLAIYVLAMTFASVDWIMSLEPHWFSTIFGMLFAASQALEAMAVSIIALFLLSRRAPLEGRLTRGHFHDLAKLLFAFTLVWTYLAFSQFLIIWGGNLAEEIPWYLARLRGGWEWMGLSLLLLQFVVPFSLLLPRSFNFRAPLVVRVAALVIVMRWVDLVWMVEPAFHPASFFVHWLDLAAPLALGGVWAGEYVRQLRRRPLLPVGDADLEEALAHGRH